jgi:hypothetical protein
VHDHGRHADVLDVSWRFAPVALLIRWFNGSRPKYLIIRVHRGGTRWKCCLTPGLHMVDPVHASVRGNPFKHAWEIRLSHVPADHLPSTN